MMCAARAPGERSGSRVVPGDPGSGPGLARSHAGTRLTMRDGSDRFLAVGAPYLHVVPPVDDAPSPIPFEPFGPPPQRAPRGLDLAEARSALDRGHFWTEYQA